MATGKVKAPESRHALSTSGPEGGPALSRPRVDRLAFWAGLVALGLIALALGALAPVPIPDTYTSTGASATAEVNDWTSVGHTFRTDRDGLYRIDVALSTLKAIPQADLQFYVREGGPAGPNLRVVRKRLDALPEGKALDLYGTRWQDLPWASFEFEPLYGYAGKQLYFNIEGKEIPRANTVQALFAYPNSYSRGEAYSTEKPRGANMLFRTFVKGSAPELLGTTLPLLALGKPGLLGREWVYGLLGAALLVLSALLFVRIARLEDQEGHQ